MISRSHMSCCCRRSSVYLDVPYCTAVQDFEGKQAPDLAAVAQGFGLHPKLAASPADDALQQDFSLYLQCSAAVQGYEGKQAPDLAAIAENVGLHQGPVVALVNYGQP